MEHEIIDKLDVVERQIKESVQLFFEGRDLVVIHTIIASAHQILFDVGKLSEIESAIKNIKSLSQAEVREFLKTVNYPYNFFKHADKDPEGKIDIGPLSRLAQDFIMDAIVMLQILKGTIPFQAKVFWFWFVSKYPEEFSNLPKDGEIATMQEANFAALDFEEIALFLKCGEALEGDGT